MPTEQNDNRNYYEILGVAEDVTPRQISLAYKNLMKRYHPDKAQGDKQKEEEAKIINNANDILCDPEKRKVYDQKLAKERQNVKQAEVKAESRQRRKHYAEA